MAPRTGAQQTPWYASRYFRVTAVFALAAVAAGQAIAGVLLKDNDFLWHRHLGEAFLAGDPVRVINTAVLDRPNLRKPA